MARPRSGPPEQASPAEKGMNALAPPQVVSCYFDDRVTPHLAAMRLRWPAGPTDLRWLLPTGEEVIGPPPERFGVWVRRQGSDEYEVSLVWNDVVVPEA